MERRRFPRVEVHLPAVYRSEHRTMDSYVCNVSQGGFALTGPSADQEGTACEVSIALPGSEEYLDLRGYIIWSNTTGTPIMGIRFDELTREQRAALANFLLARFHNP